MNFQARTENIAIQQSGDETMVYDLLIDKAYLLNATSAFVWESCNSRNDLAAIAELLAKKTNQPVSEDIVKLAIDRLKANNLLNESENVKDFFTKTSRRKVIKQVGLATMIALPTIFSLTAPAAAHAASGGTIAACQSCTQNSQCVSGKCFTNRYGGSNICTNSGAPPQYPAYPNGAAVGPPGGINCATVANRCCTNSTRDAGGGFCYCN